MTANALIIMAGIIHVYHAVVEHEDPGMPHIILYLLSAGLLLNFYSLGFMFWRVFRPLQALITTLYDTARPRELQATDRKQDEVSKLNYLLGIFHDQASHIEQTAKELKEQKDFLQSILETIPDAIITIDETGKIQMVNAAMEKIFGYSAAELLGQTVNILMPQSESEEHDRHIGRYLETGQAHVIGRRREVTAKCKDGSVFPMKLWMSKLSYSNHRGFIGVIRDITNLKNAELERENYLRELENSNRELDDFAYIVSHDLKEPLRGLQSFSRFLLEDYEDKLDEEGKKKLLTISSLTKRLETLLDTLLYYSRLGRTALAIRETNLDTVVRGVIDTLSINLKEKNTTVEVDRKLPVVVCDHVRIAEVFQNLIGNAFKYSDNKENKINVGMMTDHPRKPGETVFYVRDYGIGIAEKHLETIFRIFKRLHPRDAYGGGTGSGLAIVRKIIIQHGGEIWAESKGEGQGTTFFFTIPPPKK